MGKKVKKVNDPLEAVEEAKEEAVEEPEVEESLYVGKKVSLHGEIIKVVAERKAGDLIEITSIEGATYLEKQFTVV